jgi:hypothetical protein
VLHASYPESPSNVRRIYFRSPPPKRLTLHHTPMGLVIPQTVLILTHWEPVYSHFFLPPCKLRFFKPNPNNHSHPPSYQTKPQTKKKTAFSHKTHFWFQTQIHTTQVSTQKHTFRGPFSKKITSPHILSTRPIWWAKDINNRSNWILRFIWTKIRRVVKVRVNTLSASCQMDFVMSNPFYSCSRNFQVVISQVAYY